VPWSRTWPGRCQQPSALFSIWRRANHKSRRQNPPSGPFWFGGVPFQAEIRIIGSYQWPFPISPPSVETGKRLVPHGPHFRLLVLKEYDDMSYT